MVELSQIRSVHPYPAKMAPSIAYSVLEGHGKSMRLLDPMAGCGTTLQVGMACGHKVIGYDIDPLAVLVCRTNCSNTDPSALVETARIVASAARDEIANMPPDGGYPRDADQETRQFVDYWFDAANRRELASLTDVIRKVRATSELRQALWTVLSGTIVTKKIGVSLGADVSHSRPHRIYQSAPVTAIDAFVRRATRVAKILGSAPHAGRTLSVTVRRGDATKLPLPDKCIDIVVTSPPYVNAIDYLRGHRLSLVWLGYNLSQIRSFRASERKRTESEAVKRIAASSVGSAELANSVRRLVEGYVSDMSAITEEIARTLVRGGRAVMVVGSPTVKGTGIDTPGIFKRLADCVGLALVDESIRQIPDSKRYLPAPSSVSPASPLSKRLSQESILEFVKR